MKAETTDSKLNLKIARENLDPEKPFYEEIRSANLLIMPTKITDEESGTLFTENVEDFFSFLQSNSNSEVSVEIYLQDDDHEELELHADELYLPTLLFTQIILPLAVNLVSSYVYDWLRKRNKKNVQINIETIVDKEGKTKRVSFSKGTIDEWKEFMESLPDIFFEDDK